MSDDNALTSKRIFPRNLTARAATLVRGNPANARPESGVDNSHPGLEFDPRNLDKRFFPGLVFEFQFLEGAKLVEICPEAFQTPNALRPSDITSGVELYLYYVYGHFGATPAHKHRARLAELHRTDGLADGYEVLRTVRDLEPGRIMVVIGPKDPAQLKDLGKDGALKLYTMINHRDDRMERSGATLFRSLRDQSLLAAVIVGDRAEYLDAKGVITPDALLPGELTRSLCAPWQWDFADCGCHYWASNKPDLVFGPDEEKDIEQILNFQRLRKGEPPAPTTPPANTHEKWVDAETMMSQQQMIVDWEKLPFVIAERETTVAAVRPPPPIDDPWPRAKMVSVLMELATVEHALCVEYLYAFYSLDAPRDQPRDNSQPALDMYTAAQAVRSIAIDEMRHFRWSNEALKLLGAPISLGRAGNLNPAGDPRKILHAFDLQPLTKKRLDAFIGVEEPSKKYGQGAPLDGLYTHLLVSLSREIDGIDPDTRKRLVELIKLIVDEGHEHWQRFKRVRDVLKPYDEDKYLRVKGGPRQGRDDDPKADHVNDLLTAADWNYRLILEGIQEAFADRPVERAVHINDARLTMFNLDDLGQELAGHGYGMFFTLPNPENRKADQQRANEALANLQQRKRGSAPYLARLRQLNARHHG